MTLLAFDFDAEYRSTTNFAQADALCRLISAQSLPEEDVIIAKITRDVNAIFYDNVSRLPDIVYTSTRPHPGMNRMKTLARSHVFWTKINDDLEKLGRNCADCQETASKTRSVRGHAQTRHGAGSISISPAQWTESHT
ncbi:hypothetical protein TELCIR_05514 [Teladorsagia circumcincta]|uniref:RNA-directed DNA polymerase n=1 Tax=Teladorsagia circumcincta TaxID=45464 RepID=A0A2G9UQI6_TELCI|nr:hypothetical protein TELCIR_05514 [Teladorsagia circumcincta]